MVILWWPLLAMPWAACRPAFGNTNSSAVSDTEAKNGNKNCWESKDTLTKRWNIGVIVPPIISLKWEEPDPGSAPHDSILTSWPHRSSIGWQWHPWSVCMCCSSSQARGDLCLYTHKRIEVIIIRRRRNTPKIGTWLDMVGYVEHARKNGLVRNNEPFLRSFCMAKRCAMSKMGKNGAMLDGWLKPGDRKFDIRVFSHGCNYVWFFHLWIQ